MSTGGRAAFGASVAIWERNLESCAAAAAEIGALGITTDVRDSAQVDAALTRTVAELGPVAILVNNAGGVFHSSILETTENGWDALYRANLRHVYQCTQRVARGIVAKKTSGRIINVTSIEGIRAAPGVSDHMSRLTVSIAISPYDHVRDLTDGRIKAHGLDLVVNELLVEEIFFRTASHREWDVCEFSLGKCVPLPARRHQTDRASGVPFQDVSAVIDLHDPRQRPQRCYVTGRKARRDSGVGSDCNNHLRGWLTEQLGIGLSQIAWVRAG